MPSRERSEEAGENTFDRGIRTEGRKDLKGFGVAFPRTELGWIVTGTPLKASATLRLDEDLAKHPNLISLCDLCDLLCRFSLFSTGEFVQKGAKISKVSELPFRGPSLVGS